MEYSRMRFKIKDERKKKADEVLAKLGMNYNDAVKLFFAALIEKQDFPFYGDCVGIPDVTPSDYYRLHNIDIAVIFVRIPTSIKEKACEVIEKLGTTPSTAVDMFLNELVKNGKIPFDRVDISNILRQDSSNSKAAGVGQGSVFNINVNTINLTINGVPADAISKGVIPETVA